MPSAESVDSIRSPGIKQNLMAEVRPLINVNHGVRLLSDGRVERFDVPPTADSLHLALFVLQTTVNHEVVSSHEATAISALSHVGMNHIRQYAAGRNDLYEGFDAIYHKAPYLGLGPEAGISTQEMLQYSGK